MRLALEHPALHFDGVLGVEIGDDEHGGFVRPWRVSFERWMMFPNLATEPLAVGEMPMKPSHLASAGAGIRLTFRTDSTTLRFRAIDPMTPLSQLVVDGRHVGDGFEFDGLDPAMKTVELWLGQLSDLKLRGIDIDDGATVEARTDDRPRWLTYGSSITHGTDASSPLTAWPTVVARENDLHLINLGMSGNCYLEINMARLIRDTPADFITLCLGINVYGDPRLNRTTFPAAVAGLVEIIREKHTDTPLTLVGPISSPPREDEVGGCGMTLNQLRDHVRETAALLGERYVDGRELIGPGDMAGMPDLLHPNDGGNALLAERFAAKVLAPMRTPWLSTKGTQRVGEVGLLDPAAARHLRDTPTEKITLPIGREVWETAGFDVRTLRPAVIGFIELIREKQAVPIEVVLPEGGSETNAAGLSLDAVRLEIEAAVATLQDAGDQAVAICG
ncbi:MAG: GDSL-type esterase/lipase family protein [Planctomycetota bacterium]